MLVANEVLSRVAAAMLVDRCCVHNGLDIASLVADNGFVALALNLAVTDIGQEAAKLTVVNGLEN